MKLFITRPAPEEAEELSSIALNAKKHWGYPDEWLALWKDDLTITPEILASRDFYVGRTKKKIVFFYSINKVSSDLYDLDDAWIAPQYIGQGFGRIMFDHVRGNLESLGCSKLLIVSDPNAEGFYLKMGAKRIGEEPSKPEGRMLPLLEMAIQPNSS